MAQGDPSGWESLGLNDPTRYRAVIRLKRTIRGSTPSRQNVRVITNRANGNYDVYETNFGSADRLIYSYNASNNKTTISNSNAYNEIFTGQNSQQLSIFNKDVRSATLKLAENNVSGSTSKRQLTQLKNSPGYKSLANKADPPPPPERTQESGTDGSQLTPISDVNQIPGRATDDTFDTLKYPKTPAVGDKFDYLKIDVIKYVPPGLGVNGNFNVKRFDEPGGEGRATNILGSVFLPMQPGITDSNGASWNEDRLNPFQAALGGTAAQALNNFGAGNIGKGVDDFIKSAKEAVRKLTESGNVQQYLTAYFAGEAVGSNIIARQTGAVINNNLELLFNGPKLRTFQYNFRFTPRDDKEAREIRQIIRVFKRNLAPSQTSDGLFLASPNVFRLKYIYGNTQDQHPFLNKIGICALTDMSVNYTPDGTYMTYGEDGSMTSYTMTLQFSELNPIYREDYDTPEGKQGMGY